MNCCVIFAGGTGHRMESDLPKQFLKINEKPIIAYTIDKFEQHPEIDSIIIVCLEDYLKEMEAIIAKYSYKKVVSIVKGGKSALESQLNGLQEISKIYKNSINDVIVLLHDGVRPFVSQNNITNCIKMVNCKGSAVTIAPAVETIALLNSESCITKIYPRQISYIARAPQCYRFLELWEVFCNNIKELDLYVDSASLMIKSKKKIYTVEGDFKNIKITTQFDFELAKMFLNK